MAVGIKVGGLGCKISKELIIWGGGGDADDHSVLKIILMLMPVLMPM